MVHIVTLDQPRWDRHRGGIVNRDQPIFREIYVPILDRAAS